MFVPVLGLIGGVGSGKSTVAGWLAQKRNVPILSGDEFGHRVLKDPSVQQQIRERFGDSVLNRQGEVIREALSRLVFGNTADQRECLADLESIVHPKIREAFIEQIADVRDSVESEAIILDAAVMLEAGWNDLCDAVIFVDAPYEVRLKRVIAKRGWKEEELQIRESSQQPLESKRKAADYTIDNSRTVSEAGAQLERILDQITHDCSRRPR